MTSDQSYLPGMEPKRMFPIARQFYPHRYYFALRPDLPATDAAMKISMGLRRSAKGSAVKRENLHVSLFPLWEGEAVPPDLLPVTFTMLQAIEGRPFDIVFDRVTSFRRKNGYCIVLTAAHSPFELYNLHRKFVERFEGMVRAGSLTPHLTLLYTDRSFGERSIEPVRWTVRDFVLAHSVVGQGRQEIVGRWPLR